MNRDVAATPLPPPLDLKRRLLLRVTLFAGLLFLTASAVVLGLAVQRIPAEIERTGGTIQQLISDEIARRTTTFDYRLARLDLDGLAGLGSLVHFCASLENIYTQPVTRRCFGETGAADGGYRLPARGLARLLQALVSERAVYRSTVGTQPGVKIADLTVLPHYDSEALRVGRQLLGLLALTLGVLLINVLVYLPVRKALAPTPRILQALERMQAGDLSVRMPRVELMELDSIAQGFNHLAERLEATLQARTQLAQRLLQVREEERRHLARELHDELGQCLASINAEAAFAGDVAREQLPTLQPCVQAIARTTGRMMAALQGILHRLRPLGLEEFGLAASLEQLVDGWQRSQRGRCAYTLRLDGELDNLPDDLNVSLYRIVQESLTNASKHGRPSRVDVWLECAAGSGALSLVVEDDGAAQPEVDQPQGSGHGLLGMHERVLALDGTLRIERRVPQGVRVRVWLPAPQAAARTNADAAMAGGIAA